MAVLCSVLIPTLHGTRKETAFLVLVLALLYLTGSSHMPWLLCELAMCASEPVCLCMGEAFVPREHHWARLLVGRFCPEPFLLLLFLLSPTSLMSTEQVFLLLALLFGQSLPTGTRKRKRSSCTVSASMSPLLFLAPSGTGVLWSQGRDPAFEKLITGRGCCSLCAPFFPSAYSRWRAALWAQYWLALACAHINISFLQGPVYPASGHEKWNSRKKPKVYHGLSLTGLNTSTVFTMAPVLWVFLRANCEPCWKVCVGRSTSFFPFNLNSSPSWHDNPSIKS